MKSIKSFVVIFLVTVFFLSGFWSMCFRVDNEIGPIGADKVGRQVLLQSLDHYFDHAVDSVQAGYSIDIESEFNRTPFLIRLAQEPMRTTFLLSYRVKETSMIDSMFAERLLNANAADFIDLFQGPATIQDEIEIPADSLRGRMAKLNVVTFADFLSAFGFRHFAANVNGKPIIARELPEIGRANIKWVGGN